MFAYDPTDFAANEFLLQQAVMNAFTQLLLLIICLVAAVSALAVLTALGGMLWQVFTPVKPAAHNPTVQPSDDTAQAARIQAKSLQSHLLLDS